MIILVVYLKKNNQIIECSTCDSVAINVSDIIADGCNLRGVDFSKVGVAYYESDDIEYLELKRILRDQVSEQKLLTDLKGKPVEYVKRDVMAELDALKAELADIKAKVQ